MQDTGWILGEPLAGLMSQATGLADAAGVAMTRRLLVARPPWRWLAPRSWPAPLRAVGMAAAVPPPLLIACGGMGGAVGAALRKRRPGTRLVQIQNPRSDLRRFDLVIANAHDRLHGPNVVSVRTALHGASPARLAEAAATWAPRLAQLPRPLVSVLVGGSNGRFRFGPAEAAALAAQLAGMMRADRVGLALTPSRRTGPVATRILADALVPLGAHVWDGTGDNPYFGLLALADAIVVTIDSVSMVSEAVATGAPVLLAPLPGRSRRILRFAGDMRDAGRARDFAGRFAHWPTSPLDDTPMAAAEMRRRLGLP